MRRAFTCSALSPLQGFQPGKDSRTAKVVRDDVGGTFAQLRLGDELSELPRSYSQRHVQTALLDEQGGAAGHRQSGGSLSEDSQAVRGGESALLEETTEVYQSACLTRIARLLPFPSPLLHLRRELVSEVEREFPR